jgi:Fic family protein
MSSISPKYLNSLSFSQDQISTLRTIGEYCGKQELFRRQRPEILQSLRTIAIVESSESSNRLEGITAPHGRLKKLVLQNTAPRNRSEQEIAGYRDALNLIHDAALEMPFSQNVILQLHSLIYRYRPEEGGRWKMTDNEIVERDPDGQILRVRFRPVSAVGTPQAMEDLTTRFRDGMQAQQRESLVMIPLTVLDFLCIHPFQDGNGRVARLLTLMLLYQSRYEVGRFISLDRIFEESREDYYDTLEASSRGWHDAAHDANPWLTYSWGVLLRAYREFEQRVGTIGGGRGSKAEQVRHAVLRRTRPFRISELEVDCPGISRETIRGVLRELRTGGMVACGGVGRGARWRVLDPG